MEAPTRGIVLLCYKAPSVRILYRRQVAGTYVLELAGHATLLATLATHAALLAAHATAAHASCLASGHALASSGCLPAAHAALACASALQAGAGTCQTPLSVPYGASVGAAVQIESLQVRSQVLPALWHGICTTALRLGATQCSTLLIEVLGCMTDTSDPTSAPCDVSVHKSSQTHSLEPKQYASMDVPLHRLPSCPGHRWPAEIHDLRSARDIRIHLHGQFYPPQAPHS